MSGLLPCKPLVGLLDSGISPHQRAAVHRVADFTASPCEVVNGCERDVIDLLGHGSTLAQVLLDYGGNPQMAVARIFDRQLTTSASQAAAGLHWLVEQGVRVINLSFGLRTDSQPLRIACQRALAQGVVLVASAPAFGAPVYPSRYDGVIRVTGDVRCQPGEYSCNPSPQADFGACVRAGHPRVVGASVATAYITAQIAALLDACPQHELSSETLRQHLREDARFQLPQRPFIPIPWQRRLTWAGDVK
ncbi:S8 family serine peptidase [Pseudomonas stutzeri]|nr:S8 family serine peptidase [Stutzerimonas stutzeri]